MDDFIKHIVIEAGEAILPMFGKARVKYTKEGEHDVVTEADLISNTIMSTAIREEFPDHGIISEELPEDRKVREKEYIWTLDPLDGTKNFSTERPIFAVMASLLQNKKPILSAIYFPITKSLLWSKKGSGAYLNDAKIQCSARNSLTNSYGEARQRESIELNENEVLKKSLTFLKSSLKTPFSFDDVHCIADATLQIATGNRDWLVISKSHLWDIAPAVLILEESGCKVTDGLNNPFSISTTSLVASNGTLHKNLIDILNN